MKFCGLLSEKKKGPIIDRVTGPGRVIAFWGKKIFFSVSSRNVWNTNYTEMKKYVKNPVISIWFPQAPIILLELNIYIN